MKPVIIIYAMVLAGVYTGYSPQQVMVDVTNDFGICVLQLVSSRRENVAFSPYGIVSVGLVLYEGANGPTAAEIHNTLRLPWDRHVTRIGFRDIHRHLKSYFTNDGFLRGLVLSKPNVILHWNYTRQLQFYGFDLKPADTTAKVPSTAPITPMEPNHSSTFFALPTTDATTFMSTHQSSKTDITTTENIKLETEDLSLTTTTTSPLTNTATTNESKTTLTNAPTINLATTENMYSISSSPPITSTLILESTTETTLKEIETTVITTQLYSNPTMTPSTTEPTTTPSTAEPTTTPSTAEPTTTPSTAEPTTTASSTEPTTIPTQTTSSPFIGTMTTNIISESTKQDTTMLLTTPTNPQKEGRENENELPGITTWAKESTVTVTNQNSEISAESTTQPIAPQTLTPNPPEATSTPQSQSTNTEDITIPMVETFVSTTLYPDPSTTPTTTQAIIATPSETIIQETTTQGTTIPDITPIQTSLPETSASIEETDTSSASSEEADMSSAFLEETDTISGVTTISTIATTTSRELTTDEVTTQQATMSRTKEPPSDTETSRKKRALYYKGNVAEHREGISNWVPHYQDPRWNYHAPLENWFFSYFGGIKVPIITYSAYLPFAYLAEFSTLALQVPLDDPRYYMLILLPEDRNGLEKLLYSLQWCPLRGILDQLKTTPVYATVPVFTIVKHLNLVPALAKLGILSIFDPSTADLSAMSSEKALFVRTIEQVVTVSLRKYFANYRWFEAKPGEVEQHFIANHPFAYFVLDKETQVALMTGTIVNPSAYNQ